MSISIRKRLLPALTEWFKATGGRRTGTNLEFFVSEIVEERLANFLSLAVRPKLDATSVFKQKFKSSTQATGDSRRKLSAEEIEEARRLKSDGTKTSEIAERFNCSNTSMRRYLRKV